MTTLMKELQSMMNEAQGGEADRAYKMARDRLRKLNSELEQFLLAFNKGSALEKLLTDAEADMSYFNDAAKAVLVIEDSINDLERSIESSYEQRKDEQ